MDDRSRIRLLFREAGIYHDHGLFQEAGKRYRSLVALIGAMPDPSDRARMIRVIAERARRLRQDAERVQALEAAAGMTRQQERIVREELYFARERQTDAAAFEVAAALLGFGQFNGALSEFNKLLKKDPFRIPAAKNILRCQMAVGSPQMAAGQYRRWMSDRRFPAADLEQLRRFLQSVFDRKRVGETLAAPAAAAPESLPSPPRTGEGAFDVVSLIVTWPDMEGKWLSLGLDVSGQTRRTVSAIVPMDQTDLIARLNVGAKFDDCRFFTPEAMFVEPCIVSAKTRIDSGPRTGDVSVVLRIAL